MIPSIAVMIAVVGCVVCLYVFVRSCQIVESASGGGTKVLAAFTGVASVVSIVALVVLTLMVYADAASVAADLGQLRLR